MSIEMKLKIALMAIAMGSAGLHGALESTQGRTLPSLIELDAYVITANRVPTDVANVSQSIDVIDSAEIELVSASFGSDLLKKTGSVDVIQYPGGTSGVSIRGFRPEYSNETNPHTLLLLNGRPVSSSLGGIPTSNIARIEVLKGPASAIYGPSAMGGVINIITKQSSGVLSGSVFAAYGSFKTVEAGIGIGGNLTDKISVDASFDWIDRGEDYRIGSGNDYEKGANGKEVYLNTKFARTNGIVRVGYAVSQDWSFNLLYDFSDQTGTGVPGALSKQKFNASNPSLRDLMRQGMSLDLTGKMEHHHFSSKLYYNDIDSLSIYSLDSYSSAYRGRRNLKEITEWGVQLNDMWSFRDRNDVVVGVDHGFQEEINVSRNVDGSLRTFYKPDYDREKTGLFAEWISRLMDESIILNLGGRVDRIKTTVAASTYEGTTYMFSGGSQTFEQFSPRAGVVWKLSPGWRLHSSVGTAFIAPNAEEVAGYYESEYAAYIQVKKGNPHLDPETSLTWDVGMEYRAERYTFDVTCFQTKVEDYIISIDTGEGEPAGQNCKERRIHTYVNADSQEMRGIEFTGTTELTELLMGVPGDLRITVNGTYMDKAEVRSGDYREPVMNIADWKANISIDYLLGGFSTRFGSRYNGARWDKDYTYDKHYGGDWYEYPDSWVFDWSVSWRFMETHKLSLMVENLFDAYYYEKMDYPQEGRNLKLRYEYEF